MTCKLWRAFPELDAYDDETCQRYIRRAIGAKGYGLRNALMLIAIISGFVLSLVLADPIYQVFRWCAKFLNQNNEVGVMKDTLLNLLVFGNVILMPWFFGAVTRDVMLRRAVRRQLNRAACPACQYNLIGLQVYGNAYRRCVQCPECGQEVSLANHHLTEDDVNPNLLNES